jgi:hypothetical protein
MIGKREAQLHAILGIPERRGPCPAMPRRAMCAAASASEEYLNLWSTGFPNAHNGSETSPPSL